MKCTNFGYESLENFHSVVVMGNLILHIFVDSYICVQKLSLFYQEVHLISQLERQ